MTTPFESLFEVGKGIIARYLGGTEWIKACIISLFISAGVVGLIYLLAAIFQSERLKERGKAEFNELLLSLTIFGVVTFTLAILYTVTISISPAGNNYVESAKKFFYDPPGGIFYLSYRSAYSLLSQVSIISIISTAEVNFFKYLTASLDLWSKLKATAIIGALLPEAAAVIVGIHLALKAISEFVNVSFAPYASLNVLVDPLEDLFSISIINSYIAYAQYTLIDFLNFISLRTLLPLGLLLRAFPLTRKTGSTLIALSLVGAVFYPLSINLTNIVYDEVAKKYNIEIPVILPEDFDRSVILVSPEEFSNIKGQPIVWSINSPNEAVWRIWKKVDCGKFSHKNLWSCDCEVSYDIKNVTKYSYVMDAFGNVTEISQGEREELVEEKNCKCNGYTGNNELPPQPGNYDGYKLDIKDVSQFATPLTTGIQPALPAATESCYILITNGTGRTVEFYPELENKTVTYLIDAYDYDKDSNIYTPIGRDEATFLVGNVCKGLRYVQCLGREALKVAEGIAVIFGGVGEGTLRGFANILDSLGVRGNLFLAAAAAPMVISLPIATYYMPYVAGETYTNLSKNLIPVLLPVFANILGIVISLIISVTGFRSVSSAIGGESRILGLAKLV